MGGFQDLHVPGQFRQILTSKECNQCQLGGSSTCRKVQVCKQSSYQMIIVQSAEGLVQCFLVSERKRVGLKSAFNVNLWI